MEPTPRTGGIEDSSAASRDDAADLGRRTDRELLADLAGVADRRRANALEAATAVSVAAGEHITLLEEALVVELRSRRTQSQEDVQQRART